jgi:lipid II:glycine glycyltransferase (peptidoglycan interpeptide bridge formation enzyme)
MISALVSEYCVRRGHCLTVLPRPNPHHLAPEAEVLREFGFVPRRPMDDPTRYLVNLAVAPADQMRSLDQKWRYNLRQALRAGIECRASNNPDDFAAFAALNASTQSRKGFRESETVRLMPALAGELPPSMRPWVVTAAHDGVPVAGAVVAALGDTAYYVFGASSEAGLPLKAGYALQWWIVSWLAGRGVRWYDLGGEAHEPGLRQFKKGLTGKAGAIVPMAGEFDAWRDPVGRLVSEGIYGARAAKGALQSLLGRTAR